MDRKGKRPRKTNVHDSDEDLHLPPEQKRKYVGEETHEDETEQLDTSAGQGNKRKRPVPKELKKRKKTKRDERTNSGVDERNNREETKRSKAGEKAKSNTRRDVNNDRSDRTSTSSEASGDEQDDDEHNSTFDKDESDQDELMDCAEVTAADLGNESLTEGSKPKRGSPRNFLSTEHEFTEHEFTKQHERAPITKQDSDNIDHATRLAGSTVFPRRMGKKIDIAQEYYHPTSRLRYPQKLKDTVRHNNQNIFSYPPRQTSIQTQRTYVSSSPSRKRKESSTIGPKRENKSPFHGCRKCCWVLLLLAAFAVALFAYLLMMDGVNMDGLPAAMKDVRSLVITSGCIKRKRSERFDILMTEQDKLLEQHLNLDESALSIIAGASFDHVNDFHELVRPVVLLLVGKHGDKTNVNEVAHSVATMYANVFSSKRHDSDIVGIIGTHLEESSSDEVKKQVERRIEEGFSDCSNVALVTDVDKLPPCSAILFHAYCDNDSAPHKDAVFIFTLTLNITMEENIPNLEKAAQAQLSNKWSRCPEEFSPAKIVAMHSRIANNIVII